MSVYGYLIGGMFGSERRRSFVAFHDLHEFEEFVAKVVRLNPERHAVFDVFGKFDSYDAYLALRPEDIHTTALAEVSGFDKWAGSGG